MAVVIVAIYLSNSILTDSACPVAPVHTWSYEGFSIIPRHSRAKWTWHLWDSWRLLLYTKNTHQQELWFQSLRYNYSAYIINSNSFPFGIKRIDNELTHSRVFLFVRFSPINSCPKWPPQFSHCISILIHRDQAHALTHLENFHQSLAIHSQHQTYF